MRLRHPVFLAVLILISSAFAFTQARWVVAEPVVNMYSGPSLDKDVISQAVYGSTVVDAFPGPTWDERIPEKWESVKTPDDYQGWVEKSRLRPLAENEQYPAKDKRVVTVTNRAANLYREQDVTEHAPVLTVPFETVLEVASIPKKGTDRWLEVRLVDGKTAWVQKGDVQERTGKTLTIDEAIALAKKFLGVTYTWGGTSSFGYDCSGFMQMLMRSRGKVMPRDADVQAAWSGLEPVKREELKAGDLLYFGSSAKKITHTGMYIGNGEFIHDTTHDHPMVQISRLDDQPWTKLLVACRRAK
jgi:cell wall-associated NlpC family hydrolase